MIRPSTLFVICTMFSAMALLPLSVAAQTLEEAIRATLDTNPDISASKYNLEAAEQLSNQARGGYFPTVDLVLAAGRENSNNTTTRAAGSDDLRLTREERSIQLTQLLYDGFATRNQVAQQNSLADAAVARLANVQESVSLRAVQVYLEVLRRAEVVDLARENLQQHDATLDKIRDRFDRGVGTRVDMVQTEGRRAQSQSNVLLSQRDAKNGDAEFARVVGNGPGQLSRPAAMSGLPGTLAQAIELAYQNNPELQAAEAELLAAAAARKQSRGAFHPRVDLELGATRNDDTDGTVGPNDDETAVVRLSYNLYRGGTDQARSREAEAREAAAQETVRSIRRSVQEDVTLVWNELDDIQMRLEFLQAHVRSTQEVLKVYNEQLSLGKRTLLDLLDVQNELLRARVAYLTGQYTELLARYRVLASIGRLLDSMGLAG